MKCSTHVSHDRGVALILVMLIILLISSLVAGLIFVTKTELWSAMNYRLAVQARYAAEAGVQATINWLNTSGNVPSSDLSALTTTTYPASYSGSPAVLGTLSGGPTSNWPTSATLTSYNNSLQGVATPGLSSATFSTSATLLGNSTGSGVATWMGGTVQSWQITSQGTVSNGLRSATVQVVATFSNTTQPIFTQGIVSTALGCSVSGYAPVYFNGACYTNTGTNNGPCTDSYNSNAGPYGGTNIIDSGGDISSNGYISLNSGLIYGNVYSPNITLETACPATENGINPGSTNNIKGTLVQTTLPSLPCPWGCSACGTAATACGQTGGCCPPLVTSANVVTSTQTVSSTIELGSSTTTGNPVFCPNSTTAGTCTSGSKTITTAAPFFNSTAANSGESITLSGCGASAATLSTTISSVASTTSATIATAASTSVAGTSTFKMGGTTATGCTPFVPATFTLYDGTTSSKSVDQWCMAPNTSAIPSYGNITWVDDSVLYLIGGQTYNMNSLQFVQTNGQIVIIQPLGVVSTNATTVTWVSGTQFAGCWAGSSITINGVVYTISAVNSATQITLTSSAGTQSSVSYSVGSNKPVVINMTGAGTLPTAGGASGNVASAIYEAGLGGFNMCNNGLPGNPGQLYTSGNTIGADCDNGGAACPTPGVLECTSTSTGSPAVGTATANPISGNPSMMQVVYAGTAQMRVGGAPNSIVIYMPNAPYYCPGGAVGLQGSIVSNTFVTTSNSPFHYDTALQTNATQVGPFRLIGFSWSKY